MRSPRRTISSTPRQPVSGDSSPCLTSSGPGACRRSRLTLGPGVPRSRLRACRGASRSMSRELLRTYMGDTTWFGAQRLRHPVGRALDDRVAPIAGWQLGVTAGRSGSTRRAGRSGSPAGRPQPVPRHDFKPVLIPVDRRARRRIMRSATIADLGPVDGHVNETSQPRCRHTAVEEPVGRRSTSDSWIPSGAAHQNATVSLVIGVHHEGPAGTTQVELTVASR